MVSDFFNAILLVTSNFQENLLHFAMKDLVAQRFWEWYDKLSLKTFLSCTTSL